MSEGRSGVLVPVSDTPTANETVRYAVASAEGKKVHLVFVSPSARRRSQRGEEVLEKARIWAEEEDPDADIVTDVLGTGVYLFGPADYADVLTRYSSKKGVGRVVLDPNYRVSATSPALQPLGDEIRERSSLVVETSPVERRTRRPSLLTRGGVARFTTLFVLSYGFYLALSSFSTFDIVTGGVTAAVVALTLEHVSFETSPTARRIPGLLGRLLLYTPYLAWEIAVANFRVAYIVLHPDLPIDPSVERFEAAVWGGAAVTTLANSITLTPGTLTVESNGRELHVHALTENAREGIREGSLERAVRFVFYGRRALDHPTPEERNGGVGGD